MKLPIFIVGILVGAVLGTAGLVIYPVLGLLSPLLGICIGACAGGIAGIFTLKRSVLSCQQGVQTKLVMYRLTAYFGILAAAVSGGILGLITTFWVLAILYGRIHHVQLLTGIAFGAFLGGFPATVHVCQCMRKLREIQYQKHLGSVPENVGDLIKSIIGRMRYRGKVQNDVMAELAAHFEDELRDCSTEEEKEQKAQRLIENFGDVKLLAILLRRAKRRCRPPWRTVAVRTFQMIGVLILFFILYTGWFLTGKPTVNVDYLAVLNQMNRPQVQDEDNAWPNYEKAIALFVEPDSELGKIVNAISEHPSLGGLSDEEQQKIRKWVELNKSAWQEFVTASSKSYCYREYQYDPNAGEQDKWLFDILLPHLSTIRKLAGTGIWQARVQTDSNQPQQAIENCLVIARAGSHWHGKGTLIEQLVGIAISNMAWGEILNIVETKSLSSADLKRLQQQLVQIYPQGYPLMNVEVERLLFMDAVQHVFTEGGPGGGHLVPRGLQELQELDGNISGGRKHIMSIYLCTAASMLQASRDKTIDKGNEIYDHLEKRAKMSPYERHISDSCSVSAMILTLPKYRFLLLQVLMPAVDRASEIAYRGKALHQATVTVLALKRRRLEENEYPAKLDELVTEGYLKELPMDPFSDKPLVYKRTDNNFTLYSIGLNFKDDSSQVYRDEKGRPQLWHDEFGDAVFWPVQK